MAISDKDDFRVCGLALMTRITPGFSLRLRPRGRACVGCTEKVLRRIRNLFLIAELVKRQLFSSFEFEVLDGFFEFGHGLGPVGDGQS